jgi:hypothetical protein
MMAPFHDVGDPRLAVEPTPQTPYEEAHVYLQSAGLPPYELLVRLTEAEFAILQREFIDVRRVVLKR